MKDTTYISSKSKWSNWLVNVLVIFLLAFGIWGTFQTLDLGIGSWGNTNRVNWGLAITNFVWWIGLGHAGTLISAILLIFNQQWRKSISRIAELMTIFSLIIAATFPMIHLGRPWLLNWFIPFAGRLGGLAINFYSPLIWDFFAIGTYFLVSLMFLYIGLVPDLYLKKKSGNKFLHALKLNWKGTGKQWNIFHHTSLLIAGLVTALVISVHSIVSLDFAVSQVHGWHSTLFPPYFVLGAIFSGLAMIQIILFFLSLGKKYQSIYTAELRSRLNRLIRIFSAGMALFYFMEIVQVFQNGNEISLAVLKYKLFGANSGLIFLGMVGFNLILPLLLWMKKMERSKIASLIVAIGVCMGMWLERYWIVINTLEINPNQQSRFSFSPTVVDVSLFAGSLGLFLLMYRFIRKQIPLVPEYENI